MNTNREPLFDDEYTGDVPTKRLLAYLQSQRTKDVKIVGVYCTYAPVEIIRAMGHVPAVLCAFSNTPIEKAEAVLPGNLCSLIKSSYGYIITDTCPFFGLSDAVVAETTCDGKKKMFELIRSHKPMHVMDLPQIPDEPEALDNWTNMIGKLIRFLEMQFGKAADKERIEAAIRESNMKIGLMNRVFDYLALKPSIVGWQELYDLFFVAQGMSGKEMLPVFEDIFRKLDARLSDGYAYRPETWPRVMVTGCPIAGDAAKVFKIIEEAGGCGRCPGLMHGNETIHARV